MLRPYILVAPEPSNPSRYRFTLRAADNTPLLESVNSYGDREDALGAARRLRKLVRAITPAGAALLQVGSEDEEPQPGPRPQITAQPKAKPRSKHPIVHRRGWLR